MRNTVLQVIPAGATLMVPVDPPMELHESPFMFTALGRDSAVIRVVDTALVAIHNPTDRPSPFLFFVATQPTFMPVWLQTAMRILGGL